MTSPSNSGDPDFTSNENEIMNEEEETYYEENDMNYNYPIEEIEDDTNDNTNDDNVAAQTTHIDQMIKDRSVYDKYIDGCFIKDLKFDAF